MWPTEFWRANLMGPKLVYKWYCCVFLQQVSAHEKLGCLYSSQPCRLVVKLYFYIFKWIIISCQLDLYRRKSGFTCSKYTNIEDEYWYYIFSLVKVPCCFQPFSWLMSRYKTFNPAGETKTNLWFCLIKGHRQCVKLGSWHLWWVFRIKSFLLGYHGCKCLLLIVGSSLSRSKTERWHIYP